MSSSKALLKASRLTHLYLGVFTTPALIFFAFTGFIQTFSLHETTRGSNYKPPAILAKMGQLHKKQTLVLPVRRPQSPGQPGGPGGQAGAPGSAERPAGGDQGVGDKARDGGAGRDGGTRRERGAGREGDQAPPAGPGSQAGVAPQAGPKDGAAAGAPAGRPESPLARAKNLWPMKIFFGIVSFALLLSTVTGLYMSYKYVRNKRLITLALVAGVVMPVALLYF